METTESTDGMVTINNRSDTPLASEDDPVAPWANAASALGRGWRSIVLAGIGGGCIAFGASFVMPPVFTASTTFMPPQQTNGAGSAALSSLGSLASLTGSGGAVRNVGEQYVALLQSATVSDRLVERFALKEVYDAKLLFDARRALVNNVRVSLGRRDGLIVVEVDDTEPERAAKIANAYVEELRRITSTLAVTEAQQRRDFFERQLQQSKERLTDAQVALQATRFNSGALQAEPRVSAEEYVRLKAEATSAEVQLLVLRQSMTLNAPEVRQQQAIVSALQGQLARTTGQPSGRSVEDGADYIGALREYKYQETQYEIFTRQLEIARVDEAREGALIQVVDPALVPERKSRPRRAYMAIISALIFSLFWSGRLLWRDSSKATV